MRKATLKNKNKHRTSIWTLMAMTISLASMMSLINVERAGATGIETCPDNWTFLLDGLNPDYFDCRNDTENSNGNVDDPIPPSLKVQSKYKLQ